MISTIYIAKNAYGGDGLGRLGDGRVAFVPGTFAGENVKAEIVEERKGYVKARLVEIVEPCPERIGNDQPLVPGMVYANLSNVGEMSAKADQLREFLERARIPVEVTAAPMPEKMLNYRNKATYHFARQGGRWVIGYRKERSHEVVDITDDPLAVKEINARLGEIRNGVTMLLTQGPSAVRRDIERKGKVTVRWTAKSGVKWWVGDQGDGVVLKEVTCGRSFEVPAGGFYQVNPEVGEALVKAVVEEYERSSEIAPDVIDLYCGVGVFGLCCRPPKLIGIESGCQAVEFAVRNAAAMGIEARFFAEQVGDNVRRIPFSSRSCVILDPPRDGLEANVPRYLAMSTVPRILYVSCDPATLVRDLKTLSEGYVVESVRWFNMFPRTARFETLAVLRHK